MRNQLLTTVEKRIIQEYLETGKKLEGFRVLLFRCRRANLKTVNEDIGLVKQFLNKVEN